MRDSAVPTRRLFGLEVDALTLEQTVALAEEAVRQHERLLIGVVNAAKIAKLRTDPVLRDSLLEADLILADGQSVVWASRLLRQPLPSRVAGIDLFEELLGVADRLHLRVFLLGATAAVLARVEDEVARRWPGAVLAGSRDGYFAEEESARVADQIAGCSPDLLFLGMTTPKKEIFLGRYGDRLGVAVQHGVGGSFDVLAGVTSRAPRSWQRLGLEWAYRVAQEPRRLWRRYLVTNLAFIGLVGVELVRPQPAYPRPRSTTRLDAVTAPHPPRREHP
ncbi:WecB/TagA/CpsF family glycosyltransferase [Nocardioides lijunqiniae]|uniref:WecB/TagA/CpsF family glycosyltransferase n=1 Tax=Nocardioides lijunqiniae TaxID=2760832 RepID=UPI0018775B8E|nr:WecB/TagA/CpsF family glycosyltransferase [Nocardioides lijunqiniae]